MGTGHRGADAYGKLMAALSDKYKIVTLCDFDHEKLNKYKNQFDVSDETCSTTMTPFSRKKRSDLLIISTWDDSHVALAKLAITLGYKILLEKPISDKLDELIELRELAKKHNSFVMVCHVLRYTWENRTIMEVYGTCG